MEYEIVKYRPEFKQDVLKLQTHLWSNDLALNRDYFAWKYDDNPYISDTHIYLALYQNIPVGMRGVYGARWQTGDPSHDYLVPCAGDLVVSPDHRRSGLAKQLVEAAASRLSDHDFSYVLSLSAGLTTQMILLEAGYRSIGSPEVACKQSRRGVILGRARRNSHKFPGLRRLFAGPSGDALFRVLDGNSPAGNRGTRDHVSVERDPHPSEMAELIERVGTDGRIRHVRDERYFAWRFQNPFSVYRFIFWTDSRLEGYLVLQTPAHWSTGVVSIVDWEATSENVSDDLLQAAVKWGGFDELTTWSQALPSQARTLLQKNGFRFFDRNESLGRAYRLGIHRPRVLVRAIQEEMLGEADWVLAGRRVLDPGNWDLRMIYSDAY